MFTSILFLCLSTAINLPHCLRCPLLCIHALSGACQSTILFDGALKCTIKQVAVFQHFTSDNVCSFRQTQCIVTIICLISCWNSIANIIPAQVSSASFSLFSVLSSACFATLICSDQSFSNFIMSWTSRRTVVSFVLFSRSFWVCISA